MKTSSDALNDKATSSPANVPSDSEDVAATQSMSADDSRLLTAHRDGDVILDSRVRVASVEARPLMGVRR